MAYKYVLKYIDLADGHYPLSQYILGKVFLAKHQIKPGERAARLAWSIEDNGIFSGQSELYDGRFCINFLSTAIFSEYPESTKKEKIEMRSPEKVRQDILQYVPKGDVKKIPAGLKGKMVSEFNKIWGRDANRRIITGWIFSGEFANAMSTSVLTDTQIAALLDWMQPAHKKTGWNLSPTFRSEAALVYAYVAQEHVRTTRTTAVGQAQKMKLPEQLLKALA